MEVANGQTYVSVWILSVYDILISTVDVSYRSGDGIFMEMAVINIAIVFKILGIVENYYEIAF